MGKGREGKNSEIERRKNNTSQEGGKDKKRGGQGALERGKNTVRGQKQRETLDSPSGGKNIKTEGKHRNTKMIRNTGTPSGKWTHKR